MQPGVIAQAPTTLDWKKTTKQNATGKQKLKRIVNMTQQNIWAISVHTYQVSHTFQHVVPCATETERIGVTDEGGT